MRGPIASYEAIEDFETKKSMSVTNGVLLGVVVLLVLWAGVSAIYISTVEEPAYRIAEDRGGYEIREYPGYILAKTRVEASSYDEAASRSFGILAGYIFGENVREEGIAMTSPVSVSEGEAIAMTKPVLTEEESGEYVVSFVMPSSYDLESLPNPVDKRVVFEEVNPKLVAVRSFGGWYATEERSKEAARKLLEFLERDGIGAKSSVRIARYNPPLSMPLVLRNEALVDIE